MSQTELIEQLEKEAHDAEFGTSKKKATKKKDVVAVDGMFDVERQKEAIVLRETKRSGKNVHGIVFSTFLKKGFPGGGCPIIKVENAVLGSVGKAIDQRRGLDLVEFRLDNGAKGHIVKLALGVNKAENPDLLTLCEAVWTRFCEMHNPLKQSQWYQSKFPELDDGTKVHLASVGFDSPDEFCTMDIEESHLSWDSPARTYGEAMFGDDEEARWYPKLKVRDEYSVYCYRSNGKPYGKIAESGIPTYNKEGIPLNSVNLLKSFLGSNFYQGKQWRCTSMVQLTALEIRCGTRARFPETGNPKYGIYPVFHLRTMGSIIFTEFDDSVDSSGLTPDQRENAIMAHLFAGRQAPPRKRKARDDTTSNKKKKSDEDSKSNGNESDEEESVAE